MTPGDTPLHLASDTQSPHTQPPSSLVMTRHAMMPTASLPLNHSRNGRGLQEAQSFPRQSARSDSTRPSCGRPVDRLKAVASSCWSRCCGADVNIVFRDPPGGRAARGATLGRLAAATATPTANLRRPFWGDDNSKYTWER